MFQITIFFCVIIVPDVDWVAEGEQTMEDILSIKDNNNKAKNVILFIGDGMGLSTLMAARTYKGQKEGRPGEETYLSFEKFPNVALSKVK